MVYKRALLHGNQASGPMYSVTFGGHADGPGIMGTASVQDFRPEHNMAPGGIGVMHDAVQNPAKRARITDLFDGSTHLERALGGHDLNISNEDNPMASPSTVCVRVSALNSLNVGTAYLFTPSADPPGLDGPPTLEFSPLRVFTQEDGTYFGRALTDSEHTSERTSVLCSLQFVPKGEKWPGVVLSSEKDAADSAHQIVVVAVQHAVEVTLVASAKAGDVLLYGE